MTATRIVNMLAVGRVDDAARLFFEYMAMTEADSGRTVPASVDELPPVLSAECRTLPQTYAAPGVVLLACVGDEAVGCVGLKHLPRLDSLELKRLYVRPAYRGLGLGGALVRAAHAHAARARVAHTVLDVMPSRTSVVEFYRRVGYRDTEPYQDLTYQAAYPMVVLRRAVVAGDEPA
jgi:ribosomal protein S18 acetylase RimI-like enzyme